jgi:hypothetical protein
MYIHTYVRIIYTHTKKQFQNDIIRERESKS